MTESLEERLSKAAGSGATIATFDGQTVTITGITKEKGKFPGQEVSVKAKLLDADLNEHEVYVTPTGARQLIEVEDTFPLDLTVVSFPSSYGKTGYKFELASS